MRGGGVHVVEQLLGLAFRNTTTLVTDLKKDNKLTIFSNFQPIKQDASKRMSLSSALMIELK